MWPPPPPLPPQGGKKKKKKSKRENTDRQCDTYKFLACTTLGIPDAIAGFTNVQNPRFTHSSVQFDICKVALFVEGSSSLT